MKMANYKTAYRVLLLFTISPCLLLAQTKSFDPPAFKKFNSNEKVGYYINSASQPIPQSLHSQSTGSLGAHANYIVAQQNDRAMRQMGGRLPVIPPSDPAQLHQFIIDQYNQNKNPKDDAASEVIRDLNEVRNLEQLRPPNYYASEKFKTEDATYRKAKDLLGNMLTGKIPVSLKDAFYILESAHGNNYLNYEEYSTTLKKSSDFIRQWLNQNGHGTAEPQALHFGIQTFMHDTLTISKQMKEPLGNAKTKHIPFVYDFVDFRAEKDFRNFFVTKTLATGTGQCNSLPTVYLLLAEQLGAKTYLSYAPLHSFIKFPDDKGTIHNYEPTSHFQIPDQWYAEHLHIGHEAYSNKIYLDTLNKKQIVAGAMMDLAFGYMANHGIVDGAFIEECVEEAIAYFPNGEANVQGWLLRNTLWSAMLHRALNQHGTRDLKDIEKIPEAKKAYQQMIASKQKLKALGYQEFPTTLYEEEMRKDDAKGRAQKETRDTKQKRDLFYTFK
jgi:hypothetical protein